MQNLNGLLTREQVATIKSKYSSTTTYCQHSGVKLVIGTEFQNSFLRGKLIAHSHYIFTLSTTQLLRLAKTHLYDGNPTEQSLITNAILHKLGIVSTTCKGANSPLFIDEKTTIKLRKATNALIKQWAHYENSTIQMPQLSTLIITKENCDSYPVLVNIIKHNLAILEEHSFKTQLTTRKVNRDLERTFDNALNKEKQFQATLDSYCAKTKPKKYTKKLGTWAAKQLAIHCPDMKPEVLASINHYIQSDSTTLDNQIMKKYVKLLEEVLPMDDECYETSHLVIKHLHSKLDAINEELADYGFIILEVEEDLIARKNRTKGAGIKYKTTSKTDISTNQIIAAKDRTTTNNKGTSIAGTGSAVARLLAKYKK